MFSAHSTNRTAIRRWSLPIVACILVLGLIAASTLPGDSDPAFAAQPTDQPPTEPPPTQAPPTDIPPTEAPPTEVPPTEIPPTEEPTEEPTETPPPFPATPSVAPPPPPTSPPPPPATQPPAGPIDAGDIDIECSSFDTLATPIADPGDWVLQLCTVPLEFGAITSLDVRADSSDPGWRVILTQPDAAQTPGLLNASNNRTVLNDLAGETEATFLLGTQPTCSALGGTTLVFSFTGSHEDSTATVEATAELDLTTPSATAPELQLQAATFSGNQGTITVGHGASPANSCPWQITITFPGASVSTVAVSSGPEGVAAVPFGEAVVFTIPPGSPAGEVTVDVEVAGAPPDTVLLEGGGRP